MSDNQKSRLVGMNHIVLEVGDLDEALEFYEALFEFELRGRTKTQVFIDMGDQFLALAEGRDQGPDGHRHFGLVVDERESVREKLEEMDVEILDTRGLDFRDPWGNRVQVVLYKDIQFSKTDQVLKGMEMGDLEKTEDAIEQLKDKGLA